MPDLKVKCKTASVGGIKTPQRPKDRRIKEACWDAEFDLDNLWDEYEQHLKLDGKMTHTKTRH